MQVLSINVNLPGGQTSAIHLFQYDTPLQMAYRFAVENSLQIKYVQQISESIKQIITAALRDNKVEGIFFYSLSVEKVKVQMKQSYNKYVVESCILEFKMDYNLSDLVDLDSDYQKLKTHDQRRIVTDFGQDRTSLNVSNELKNSKIYDRSQNYKLMIEQKQQHIRSFQEQNELKNCTFSPHINHSQENITPYRFQKLYEHGKSKIIERRSYSDQKELKELQNCTFSPKIGQKSRQMSINKPKLVQSKNNPTNQVSKLLQQLMTIQIKKEIPQLKQTTYSNNEDNKNPLTQPDFTVKVKNYYQSTKLNKKVTKKFR